MATVPCDGPEHTRRRRRPSRDAAVKAASQVSTADQLEKLAQLRDAGTISVPEYEQLKAKLLAQ